MFVDIDMDMRVRADVKARELEAHYEGKRDPWGLDFGFRWYWGALGEEVFIKALEGGGVKFHRDTPESGRPDVTDFWVWAEADGNRYGIDVKTCKANHQYLFMPSEQLRLHNSSLYVAVRILDGRETRAEVCGWTVRESLKPIPRGDVAGIRCSTSGKKLKELRPIEDLYKKLKKD